MRKLLIRFCHMHWVPGRKWRDEHFIMATAYSVGAVMVHHPVGSTTVAIGYFLVGIIAVHNFESEK